MRMMLAEACNGWNERAAAACLLVLDSNELFYQAGVACGNTGRCVREHRGIACLSGKVNHFFKRCVLAFRERLRSENP